MAARTKWTNARVSALILKHAGILSLVAKDMGCTRQNVFKRVKETPMLAAAVSEVREQVLDLSEGTVVKSIQGGDGATARWYLERQGKSRGYANKVENSLDEAQLEAIVASLGGDPAKFAAALRALGVDPDQA